MSSLIDHFETQDDNQPTGLSECRLGREPTMLLAFTGDTDEVTLHYESDEAVRSYFPCPGHDCPVCFLGSAPQEFFLLPVFNVESRRVEVLRISKKRGPDSLGAHLIPHIKDPDVSNKVIFVRRDGSRYRVEVRPLSETADRGAAAISAFQTACEEGLKLSSAFPQLSSADIADVERGRRKLDAVGGFTPKEHSDESGDAAE